MGDLTRHDSPDLATTFTCTVLQFTILLMGAFNFYNILAFCQASNKSKEHPWVKTTLLLLMYFYPPIAAICIAFSWISWHEDWSAGWFFIWFAFLVPVLFFFVVFATKNDISHFIDVHRLSRAKLPQQAPPRNFVVAPSTPTRQQQQQLNRGMSEPRMPQGMLSPQNHQGFQSPPRHSVINMDRNPPVIPQTEGRNNRYVDDDDAIDGAF